MAPPPRSPAIPACGRPTSESDRGSSHRHVSRGGADTRRAECSARNSQLPADLTHRGTEAPRFASINAAAFNRIYQDVVINRILQHGFVQHRSGAYLIEDETVPGIAAFEARPFPSALLTPISITIIRPDHVCGRDALRHASRAQVPHRLTRAKRLTPPCMTIGELLALRSRVESVSRWTSSNLDSPDCRRRRRPS